MAKQVRPVSVATPGNTITYQFEELPPLHAILKIPQHDVKRFLPKKPREITGIAAHVRTAIRECARGQSPWPLVFLGETGAGKTCAALTMMDLYGGWFYTMVEWCEQVQLAMLGNLYAGGTGYYKLIAKELYRDLEDRRFFVLDELGLRDRVSNHHYETLARTLEVRESRPTVYISNLDMSALRAVYDERIVGRLVQGTVVAFVGDRRVNPKERT